MRAGEFAFWLLEMLKIRKFHLGDNSEMRAENRKKLNSWEKFTETPFHNYYY